MNPYLTPIKKAAALGLLLLGLTLPACSASWLVDPLTRYFQKKTGLEIRIQQLDWTFRPFRLTGKKIEIKRKDPALQVRLSIDRLDARFGWEFPGRPPYWPRIHIERLEASLPRGEIRIKNGETRTDWRAWFEKLPAVHALDIRRFSGVIEVDQTVFRLPSGVDLTGSIHPVTGLRLAVKSGGAQGLLSGGVSVSADGVRGEMEMIPAATPLTWKARVALSRAEIRTPRFRISGPDGGCSLQGRGKIIEIRDLDGRLADFQGIFQDLRIRGEGKLRVRGGGRWGPKEVTVSSLTLGLGGSRVSLERGADRLDGLVSGDLRLEGSLPRPRLSGKILLSGIRGEFSRFRCEDLGAVIPVQGTYPELIFTGVEVRAAGFAWPGKAFPLRLTRPQADFSARILGPGEHLSIRDIRMSSREWGRLAGGLEFDRRTGAVPNGTADLDGFPLEKLGVFFPAGGFPAAELKIPVQGRVVWQREAARAPWEFRLDLQARGLTHQRNGSPWGMEDLDTRLRARITWDASRGDWSGEGTQRLEGGKLFGNPGVIRFKEYPLEMDWQGRVKAAGEGRVLEGRARVAFVPSGPWEVSGRLDWEAGGLKYEARVNAGRVPLGAGYRFWRDQAGKEYQARLPLADIQGTAAAAFNLAGDQQGGRLRGRLTGVDLAAAGPEPSWSLRLRKVDLPLHWAYGNQAYPEPGEAEAGGLELEEINTPWIRTRDLEIPVLALKNGYEIPKTVTVPFGGGNLFLETPVLSWSGRSPVLEVGLQLQGLDLSVLLPDSQVEGSVQGDLGRIRLDNRRGEAPGSLRAAVFDGWVEARDLAVSSPFSPERRLQAQVAFDYINLEEVTGLFSFGHISGYIQGRVNGLVLKGLAPERFELTLKTREVEGVAKRINIKAVENVSLLGTGFGEPGGLQQGINRWFQDYAYREIGLSCRLAGDTFTLRGTIFEGGTEYLVKSPGLYGIDVINQNPENEISFSDMLERLQRIRSKKDSGGNPNGQ